jgi:hypothetical protein
METVDALIEALGGRPIVGDAAGVETNTVTYWVRRKRIPPEHWAALIALADERGIDGVDHELMLRLHRPRKPRKDRREEPPTPMEAAAA